MREENGYYGRDHFSSRVLSHATLDGLGSGRDATRVLAALKPTSPYLGKVHLI